MIRAPELDPNHSPVDLLGKPSHQGVTMQGAHEYESDIFLVA